MRICIPALTMPVYRCCNDQGCVCDLRILEFWISEIIRSWNGTRREKFPLREMERKRTRWLVSRLIILSRLKYESRYMKPLKRSFFSLLSFRFERDRIINTLIRDSFVFSTPFRLISILFPSARIRMGNGTINEKKIHHHSFFRFPFVPDSTVLLYPWFRFLYTLEFIGLVAMYRGEKKRERGVRVFQIQSS